MICDTIGLTADSYASMYVHGGSEVEEVYGGLNYADPIFYKMQTITGTAPIAFDSYPGHLTDYTIFGNSYQNGTPTSGNPVDVQSCGDRTSQLFDKSTAVFGKYVNEDGTTTVETGVRTAWTSDFIPVTAGASYTLNRTGSRRGKFYKADKTPYQTTNMDFSGLTTKNTFTIPDTVAYIRFSIFSGVANPDIIMLNKGSTALPYEPYGYYKIPISLGNATVTAYTAEPIRKIGDYADSKTLTTETRNIKKLVLTGNEEFTLHPDVPNLFRAYFVTDYLFKDKIIICCSHYIGAKNSISSYVQNGTTAFYYGAGILERLIYFRDNRFATADAFKSYLAAQYAAGTPVTVWYVLATPTTEPITAPALPTISGQNTLTVDTTVQPSSVSITGHIKPTGYGQLLDVNDVDILDSNSTPIFVHG